MPISTGEQRIGVRKSGGSEGTLNIFLITGKQWKSKSTPNKNPSIRTTFSKRIAKTKQIEATKALEKQLNEERRLAESVTVNILTSLNADRRKRRLGKLGKLQRRRKNDLN